MTGQNRSKIDWKTIFSAVGTLGGLMVAILGFSAASNSSINSSIGDLKDMVCRLEAIQGIGNCKR